MSRLHHTLNSIKNCLRAPGKKTGNKNDLVIITGCDSGLGYNMAIKSHNLGMNVVACVLNQNSDGAISLSKNYGKSRLKILELDLKKYDSILRTHDSVLKLLDTNTNLNLHAVVNNAGVMTFGEFEWQTNSLITNQIEINLIGTMKFTHEFLPLARKHKSRIITVTSHCGLKALPGLATYSASKAGLRLWKDALRIEMKKYGVPVINFIPGSFHAYSNITANQQKQFDEMRSSLNDDQLRFYGDYFKRYSDYLKLLSKKKAPIEIPEDGIMNSFSDALLDYKPKALYKCEPWRYTIYHLLFKVTPVSVQDWLVQIFISMPKYVSKKSFPV